MFKLKIKEVLEERKMTMARLSRVGDVAYNTVLHLCGDPYRDVNLSTLQKIADALGVTVLDLLEDVPAEDK